MLKAVYDPAMSYESGRGGLRIYIPIDKGYINYNLVHTVNTGKNADIWRLSVANITDNDLNLLRQLTKEGAEWEMAVRLSGRPDFIGGFAHGDEKATDIKLIIDNTQTDITSLTEYRTFEEMKIVVSSDGYDPSEPSVKVLEHTKEFTFNKDGVSLNQQVTWLGEYDLDSKFKSFMAMMPPLKHALTDPDDIITDSYRTLSKPQIKAISSLPIAIGKLPGFCVFGKDSGISFSMSVENYDPIYHNSYMATLSDNGGKKNYNKMYISFAGGTGNEKTEGVTAGTVWSAATHYCIEQK